MDTLIEQWLSLDMEEHDLMRPIDTPEGYQQAMRFLNVLWDRKDLVNLRGFMIWRIVQYEKKTFAHLFEEG